MIYNWNTFKENQFIEFVRGTSSQMTIGILDPTMMRNDCMI